jgi:hypothetical protein
MRVAVIGFLPCPDLLARRQVRREALCPVTLRVVARHERNQRGGGTAGDAPPPGPAEEGAPAGPATPARGLGDDGPVRGGDPAPGPVLHEVPGAAARLHAGNVKALGDSLAYLEEAGIAPASVIRECARTLGEPARAHLTPWDMVKAIDDANDNMAARSIYRRLYLSLSHFTVHASGGTLLRHVSTQGRLRRRPAKTWTRRAPARVIDAATGTLAADLAQHADRPHARSLQCHLP